MLILTISQDGILRIGDDMAIKVSRKLASEESEYTNQIQFTIGAPDSAVLLPEELTEEDSDPV